MLTALRLLNIAVWAVLLIYAMPGAWATISGGEVRRGDAWRLSVVSVAALFILGNLRWLLAADDQTLLALVTILGIVVGLFKSVLLVAYGRGPRI